MRSRYQVHTPDLAHLVQSLAWCREQKGLGIYAWLILDNHFHAILSSPDLSRILADLKRHTAKVLLAQLETEKCDWLLNQLTYYRLKHKTESRHQIWQEGSHPQALVSDAMMQQKREYLHQNPVKRGLVAVPEHWRYSSAHELCGGVLLMLRCDEWC